MIEIIEKKIKSFLNDKKFIDIFKGSSITFSGKIVGALLGLLLNFIIARFYGAEIVGVVALIDSFLTIFVIVSVMGTSISVLKFIPEHISLYSYGSAFLIFKKMLVIVLVISSSIGILLFFLSDIVAIRIFSKGNLSFLFTMASIFLIPFSLVRLNTHTLRAQQNINFFAVMQFLPKFLIVCVLLICTLLFNNQHTPIYVYFFIQSFMAVLTLFVVFSTFIKNTTDADQIKNVNFRKIITISFPMFITSAMDIVISQTTIFMLGIFSAGNEIGLFSIAVKLASLTNFILVSINSIIAPKFSKLFYLKKMDDLYHIAKKSSKLIFWSTIPILIVLLFFGTNILAIFGEDFISANDALLFLIVGQFVNAAAGSVAIMLNMTGHQKSLRNILFCAALLNIIMNYILIPNYGIIGASIANMITISFWNITAAVFVRIKLGFFISYIPFILK